jgi:L-alanine-DL-glutamate epimerase-like enolase superfamily enzyme
MRRRALLTLPLTAFASPKPLPIESISFTRYHGRAASTPGVDRQYQVQALHIYDAHRPAPYRDRSGAAAALNPASQTYLTLRAGGLESLYGPIDAECITPIRNQLAPFLKGKDALAGETLWDQMHRSNRHARAGHFMMAISAIDNALWDLRGRFFQTPVYRLLGGPSRPAVRAYGSCLGFSVEPAAARARAAELKTAGYAQQKWFIPYGPGSGAEGLAANVELVRNLREAVGPGVDLMFDAYSGWTLDYAIAWAKQVEAYRPRWIEEAFPADKIEAYAALRRATSIPVASGEHFYGRWETERYLKAGAISVVQADPEWCGGITELVKICSVASLYDAEVIPHGHSLHAALHLVASQPPATCPLVEYLITKMRTYYHFEKNVPAPVNGLFALPDRPGFGIEIDPAKVERSETL